MSKWDKFLGPSKKWNDQSTLFEEQDSAFAKISSIFNRGVEDDNVNILHIIERDIANKNCTTNSFDIITPSKRKAKDNFEIKSNLSNKLIKTNPQIKQNTPNKPNISHNKATANPIQPISPLQPFNLIDSNNSTESQNEPSQDDNTKTKHSKFGKETVDEANEDNDFDLSEEQQEIYDACIDGYNVFFTGYAGSGKSELLKRIKASLKLKYGDSVYVTAPTGIAALNIGGITIHKYAGLGCSSNYKLNELKKKANVYKWRSTKVLIIDEISMLDGKLFDTLNSLAKYCRHNDNKPFGGIQLILSGDFYQLPPVGLDRGAIYCFESSCWNETIQKAFVLTKVFRQKEMGLTKILAEIREGVLSDRAIKLLSKCGTKANFGDIKPTRLFALNKYVEQTNKNFLNQINAKMYSYNAIDSGDDYLIKYLKSECNAQDVLQLKTGCQVVLLRNLDVSDGLCNGSRGVIIRFEKATGEGLTYPYYPIVRFKSKNKGTQEVVVKEEIWIVEDKGRIAMRTQLPLKLAWALSIHKSQGMTIDSLEVDLNGVFEYGQCYVALSRARSLDGLIVKGLNPNKVKCNEKVKEFYNKLMNNNKS